MNKDPSWTDAAIEVLQTSRQPWLTVPEMIKEIRSSGIKQLTNCSYSQACRSLRSALRHHARKENGLFARSEDTNIAYALRKRLNSPEDVVKVLSNQHSPPITNGLPESEPITLSPSPPPSGSPCLSTLTVEIDPALRPPRPQRRSEPMGAFCLPSPHQSILGPKRTLTILSDSALTGSQRPVRKVRHKSKCEEEEGVVSPALPPPTPFTPSLPEILQVEEHHPVCAHLSNVVFVRWKGMEGDSHLVQGSRASVAELEITPGVCRNGSMEESEKNDVEAVCLQPTPTTQLLVRRAVHHKKVQRQADAPRREVGEEVASSVCGPDSGRRRDAPRHSGANWRTEIIRQVTNLFLPGSLLVGENLKTLLSPAAYSGLLEQQKRKLVALLPAVDRQDGIKVADGSWTNELFGSALREWHERLAVGAFTPEHRARIRAEEKRQGALRTDDLWKQQFYEDYWGERCNDTVAPTHPPYYPYPYPSSLPPHHLTSLKAIRANYGVSPHQDEPPPPSPPVAQSSPAKHVEMKPVPKPAPQNNFIPNRKAHQLSCKLKKTMKASKHKTVVKRLGIHARKAHQLTPLPPKTPFQTLLLALVQSSQPHLPPSPSNYVPPPPHTHPVFHDHFALLSAEHVPEEFCAPITNLLVRLPRTLYATCLKGKTVTRDHCYTGLPDTTTLKLSVPRSLLRTTCVCSGAPLVFCSMCHALYHISCTHRNLCPSCCKCKA